MGEKDEKKILCGSFCAKARKIALRRADLTAKGEISRLQAYLSKNHFSLHAFFFALINDDITEFFNALRILGTAIGRPTRIMRLS